MKTFSEIVNHLRRDQPRGKTADAWAVAGHCMRISGNDPKAGIAQMRKDVDYYSGVALTASSVPAKKRAEACKRACLRVITFIES